MLDYEGCVRSFTGGLKRLGGEGIRFRRITAGEWNFPPQSEPLYRISPRNCTSVTVGLIYSRFSSPYVFHFLKEVEMSTEVWRMPVALNVGSDDPLEGVPGDPGLIEIRSQMA